METLNTHSEIVNSNLTELQKQVQIMLLQHGLNFDVKKMRLKAIDENGIEYDCNYFGLGNTKTKEIINTVKEGYTISQNSEVVEMVLRGAQKFSNDLEVTKAGSLNGGRKTYIQLAINGDSKVGFDTIKKYITIIDSNDGSTGLSVGIGDLTMSCQNQFFKFYKRGESKFRHTATIEQRIKEIPYLIETALVESMELINKYNAMANYSIDKNVVNDLIKTLIKIEDKPSSRVLNMVSNLSDNIQNQTNDKGLNLWGLHSGVTRWTTFDKSAPIRENGRIESLMLGTNYKTNQDSLNFATKLLQLA